MSQTQRPAVDAAAPPAPPLPAAPTPPDMSRAPQRAEYREAVRVKPREAHQKFDIPPGRRLAGYSYLWSALKVPYSAVRSRRLAEYRAAGWQFVRAADMPELSGYKPQAQVNTRFVELGIDDEVRADDPVILDGSVLMIRPERFTEEAERERTQAAHRQLREHLQRQHEKSAREIGESRTFIRTNAETPDEAPSDRDAEYQ